MHTWSFASFASFAGLNKKLATICRWHLQVNCTTIHQSYESSFKVLCLFK